MTSGTAKLKGPMLLRPMVCTTIGLVGNVLLTAGKLIVGVLAGSASLVADGFHSFSDLAGDVGVLVALKASSRPPDDDHPYGHQDFETLGALGASLLLLATGVLLGREAVMSFVNGHHAHPELPALIAALLSVVFKEAMARYTFAAGRLHNSPALQANAVHHRSDALSSIAAAVGITGALAGRPEFDSLAALLIAILIVWMGLVLLRDNAMILLDTQPDEEILDSIREAVMSVENICSVSSLRVRPQGSVYLADLAVTVLPDLTVHDGHELAHQVEQAIHTAVPDVVDAVVHVEPHEGECLRCPPKNDRISSRPRA
jgi:cation diffusion facilitator family transporter